LGKGSLNLSSLPPNRHVDLFFTELLDPVKHADIPQSSDPDSTRPWEWFQDDRRVSGSIHSHQLGVNGTGDGLRNTLLILTGKFRAFHAEDKVSCIICDNKPPYKILTSKRFRQHFSESHGWALHTIRLQRRPALPGHHRPRRDDRAADHGGAELDGALEAMSLGSGLAAHAARVMSPQQARRPLTY